MRRPFAPPPGLAFAVAMLAAATLLLELMATRLFSVLFFYHFSFFAVSLVMSGLALGGIAVSRWDLQDCAPAVYRDRLAALALAFSVATLLSLVSLAGRGEAPDDLSLGGVAVRALAFLPGLVAAGAFLAAAFARHEAWIGRLYAADLIAAAAACVAAIFLMRWVQGPAMLLCPVLLAAAAGLCLRPRRTLRLACGLLVLAALAGAAVNANSAGRFLRLGGADRDSLLERWNEHSRILVTQPRQSNDFRRILIDRSALTYMQRVPPAPPGRLVEVDPSSEDSVRYLAYRLGRPISSAAIIGVGGGDDLAPPLLHGARRVDGYELNGILVDLLAREFTDFNAIASRPEVHLIHSEARVGIAHSGRRYDVIQASLIDTWAATASGGFVLSENGLYTVQGWRIFLAALSDRGLLTMTRWLIPAAPAETQRLVSLAAEALAEQGIAAPASHVLLAAEKSPGAKAMMATIVVSKAPFTADEVARFTAACRSEESEPILVPGQVPADPVLARLLAPATRLQAVRESPFDISPPVDARPYFFLQIRPRDVLSLARGNYGSVTEITFNGIRVMVVLGALALLLTLAVLLLAAFTLPSSEPTPAQKAVYRWMSLYFLGIGAGYMLFQLGLHQRLILILGHPTFALSVVLFSLLLGTGLGAALSARLFAPDRYRRAWLAILALLAALTASFPAFALLERIGTSSGRAAAAAVVLAATGFVLGFAFPIGVRLVGPTGQWAVQKMWAVNGAAAIAGSALAAFIGVSFGSQAVLATGLAAYVLAVACGWRALRSVPPLAAPPP